jgi:GNAT superfamily N-acetyltransferase
VLTRATLVPQPHRRPVAGSYARGMPGTIRSLARPDAAEVAVVFAASRRAAMPWLPVLHTPDEDRAFFASEVESSTGWGLFEDGRLVGFALARDGWLNHLYVDPDRRGTGVGTLLLSRVLEDSPSGVDLWAFARNEAALAFYARRGFEVVERTDGSANEEREPDVRMRHPAVIGVRVADDADAEAVAAVHVRSWRAAYAGLVDEAHLAGLDVDDRARRWRERLAGGGPAAVTYVATLGTGVVGFASVGPVRDEDLARQQERWTEVFALYVDPDRWGAGVGRALWGAVEAGLAEETAAVALWVLRDNVRAREFYASRGLAPDGAERLTRIGSRQLTELRMVISGY